MIKTSKGWVNLWNVSKPQPVEYDWPQLTGKYDADEIAAINASRRDYQTSELAKRNAIYN